MYCHYCGKKNRDGAKYCAYCGVELKPDNAPSSSNSPKEAQASNSSPGAPPPSGGSNKNKRKRNLIILLIIIAAAVIVAVLLFVPGRRSQSYIPVEEDTILESNGNMVIMNAGFTDRPITDEESAILAAQDVSEEMGYENAFDELSLYISTHTNGEIDYRLQENYHGIPVYQRYIIVTASEENDSLGIYTDAVDIPEDISLTPTITYDEVCASIQEYAQDNWDVVYDDMTISELSDDSLVIYTLDKSAPACLAYELTVNNDNIYEVVVNAETGDVLDCYSTVSNVQSTGEAYINPSGTLSEVITCEYDEESDTYIMCDTARNIYVYNLNKYASEENLFDEYTSDVISYGDNIFGNSSEEIDNEVYTAANLMINVYDIIAFYDTMGQGIPFGYLKLYYNDGDYDGKNAGGGWNPTFSFGCLKVGYGFDCTEKDILAHEYTHIVMYEHQAATQANDDGVSEGLADTFACFFTGEWDIDLTKAGLSHRNAKDPSLYNYPANISDKNFIFMSGESDDHAYATVYSHAAYLMYESGEFTMEELEELWYKTLIKLPTNCSCSDFALCMREVASSDFFYTYDQQSAVLNALYQVGLINETGELNINRNVTLNVYDKNGNTYDDYTVEIDGKKERFFNKNSYIDYHDEFTVNTADAYKFKLPDGYYTITVRDNGGDPDSPKEFSFQVYVKRANGGGNLSCSDFGADYTVAPHAEIIVEDDNGYSVNILSARVRSYEINEDGNYVEPILLPGNKLDVDEYNYYDLLLKIPSNKSTESDEDVDETISLKITVRIKKGADDSLTINLPFYYILDENGEIKEGSDASIEVKENGERFEAEETEDENVLLSADYNIQKQNLSAYNDAGTLKATLTYDLVTLNEMNDACQNINTILYSDYQRFEDEVDSGRIGGEYRLDDVLAYDDLVIGDTTSASVMYNDNGIFSVKFDSGYYTSFAMGVESNTYAKTFSLNTGEQLSITDMTDMDDEELMDSVRSVVRDWVSRGHSIDNEYDKYYFEKVDSLTLDSFDDGTSGGILAWYVVDGEIVIYVKEGRILDNASGPAELPTGIYITNINE